MSRVLTARLLISLAGLVLVTRVASVVVPTPPPPPQPTPAVIFVPVEPVPSPPGGVPSPTPTPRHSPSPSPSPTPCADATTTSLPPPSATPRPTLPPILPTPPPAGCATTSASLIIAHVSAATAIAPTTTCANGLDNTGGLGLICEVTVLNTITVAGGSSTVTVRECHGAAGDPQASCVTRSSVLASPVTNVTQCNGSANGGGSTLRCSVKVTNTFGGVSQTATAASVNQCNGSGGGITTGCKPFPATASGATITQCNGSANGGTLVGLTCTASGTNAPALAVTINQCNNSANGGGSLVVCTTSLVNNQVVTETPTPSIPPLPNASIASSSSPLLPGGLLLLVFSILAFSRRVLWPICIEVPDG